MAVSDAHVLPGCLTPVRTQLSFPKPPATFSHASVEVRGENSNCTRSGGWLVLSVLNAILTT